MGGAKSLSIGRYDSVTSGRVGKAQRAHADFVEQLKSSTFGCDQPNSLRFSRKRVRVGTLRFAHPTITALPWFSGMLVPLISRG